MNITLLTYSDSYVISVPYLCQLYLRHDVGHFDIAFLVNFIMPVHCCAFNCTNRNMVASRQTTGIKSYRFPTFTQYVILPHNMEIITLPYVCGRWLGDATVCCYRNLYGI